MPKVKASYRCSSCEASFPQWAGRCSACGDWNTLVEHLPVAGRVGRTATKAVAVPMSLTDAVADIAVAFSTGVVEVDRVLGGGFTNGSVTLLGGEPGIGKSTLVLQMCAGVARSGRRCLVVTGEESASQVGRRAQRLGVDHPNISLLAESDVDAILEAITLTRPDMVIIDSVQTMATAAVASAAGTVSQVREGAAAFTARAKAEGIAMLFIGHVTKEGALAGPRVLEHLVDTVLEFEGDRHHGLRFLRAVKHRFGATDEVGVLAMAGSGLESVPDASGLFLDDRTSGIAGSIVTPVLSGRRPLLVEIQALVDENPNSPQPRRVAQGLDNGRFALILAVLSGRAETRLGQHDVFASVVGGIRLDDPGADLGIALAIASAAGETPLDDSLVAIGEIGLGGEVRKVPQMERRLAEAVRMGFKRAFVPQGFTKVVDGLEIVGVGTLREAIDKLHIKRVKPVSDERAQQLAARTK